MLFRLVVFCSIVTVGSTADAACKSCKDAVSNLFNMAQSVMAGVEPLALQDIQVCKILTVTGLKTIKAYGTPCIKPTGKTEFFQEIGLEFDQFNINCSLKSISELFQAIGLPAIPNIPIPNISMPKMPSFGSWGGGKKKEEPTTPPPPPKSNGLLANWAGLKLVITMKMDFENDVFDILSSTVADIKVGALKLACDGDSMIVKSCGLILKQKQISDIFGYIAQHVVKQVIGTVLKTDSLKDLITMLNCGEPDPPDD